MIFYFRKSLLVVFLGLVAPATMSAIQNGTTNALSATGNERMAQLYTQVVSVCQTQNSAQCDQLLETILAFAETNKLGGNPTFAMAMTLLINNAPAAKTNPFPYLERAFQVIGPTEKTNPAASMLCISAMRAIGNQTLPSARKNADIEKLRPFCQRELGSLDQASARAHEVATGDYSETENLSKQQRLAAKKIAALKQEAENTLEKGDKEHCNLLLEQILIIAEQNHLGSEKNFELALQLIPAASGTNLEKALRYIERVLKIPGVPDKGNLTATACTQLRIVALQNTEPGQIAKKIAIAESRLPLCKEVLEPTRQAYVAETAQKAGDPPGNEGLNSSQEAVAAKISDLTMQAMQAYKSGRKERVAPLFQEILTIAEQNKIGSEQSFVQSFSLVTFASNNDLETALGYGEHILKILGPDAQPNTIDYLCGQIFGVGLSGAMKSRNLEKINEADQRMPVCSKQIAIIRNVAQMQAATAQGNNPTEFQKLGISEEKAKQLAATAEITKQIQRGDYSTAYDYVKNTMRENPKMASSSNVGPIGWSIFSLLSDHAEDAKPYVMKLESDPRNYEKHADSKELALQDISIPEFTKTYWGTVSIASFYHLIFGRQDDALGRNALQLILSLKNKDLDDTGSYITQLRKPSVSENPRVRALKQEYGRISSLWASASIHRKKISEHELALAKEALERAELDFDRSKGSNTFNNGVTQGPRVAVIQNILNQNDALVECAEIWFPEFHHGRKPPLNIPPQDSDVHYVAYVLRHNGQPRGFDLGRAAEINKEIEKYLGLLRKTPLEISEAERHQINVDLQAVAHHLYAMLWKPLLSMLPSTNSIPHIYLAPDSTLNLLPFDALRDDNGQYLIRNWNISYLTSGRQLGEVIPATRSGATGIYIFADPMNNVDSEQCSAISPEVMPQKLNGARAKITRSGSLSGTYEVLPFAKLEAVSVSRILKGSELCSGPAATERKLKSIHSPKLLHLATHGYYVDPEKLPGEGRGSSLKKAQYRFLRSGLILSEFGKQGPIEDGVLTSLEIALLDLNKTDLVVLSACDSGVGDSTPGDSMAGMRSAFHLAGAKALVSSLWSVNDESGREIMTDFYSELTGRVNGSKETSTEYRAKTISESLRQAKLTWLDSHNDEQPFYWAPFVLEGKDQILFSPRNAN